MENLNVKTVMKYVNLLGFATKVPMLLLEYYNQWADHMEDNLNGIDVDIWRSIEKGPYHADLIQVVGNACIAEDMIAQGNNKKANDERCLCELPGALPLVVYNYV
ncbi:unnamed protein product [Lactuca saligna]|uniref:Uncharacterized protein n=1 Tax=Lactuca saligna TaxID=75948 RepID=A0AA36ELE5_LACSI|nr:unnamed protein product [Lactuca saligna]